MKTSAPAFDLHQVKKVRMRRLVAAGVLAGLVLVGLLFWSRQIIQEVVVVPLSYLFWVSGLLIRGTPQLFFWLATLLITLLMAINSFSDRRKAAPLAMIHPGLNDVPQASGRMAYWALRVSLMNSGRGSYFERTYHSALGRLLIETLAYRYRLSVRQVEKQLRDGTLEVPGEVRAYALGGMDHYPSAQGGAFQRLKQDLRDLVRGWMVRLKLTPPEPPDPRIPVVLNYLKEELEVSHDDSGR